MTPEEPEIVQQKLREVAEILYNNTPSKKLETFETVELSIREHLINNSSPRNRRICLGARSLDEFYSSGWHRFFGSAGGRKESER